jgi:hypothetical protein
VPADARTLSGKEAPSGSGYAPLDFTRLECSSCQGARALKPFAQAAGFSHQRVSSTGPNPFKAAALQGRDQVCVHLTQVCVDLTQVSVNLTQVCVKPTQSGWTAAMRLLDATRDVHANCGGQIRQRVMEAIRVCGENTLVRRRRHRASLRALERASRGSECAHADGAVGGCGLTGGSCKGCWGAPLLPASTKPTPQSSRRRSRCSR